jgi:ABC-2 type transport system permease protein
VIAAAPVRNALAESGTLAWRSLRQIPRSPEKLMDVTVQPLLFTLLFAYVFGSVISVPGGGNYREYLIGGMFAQSVLGPLMGIAVGMADDVQSGLVDRLRALPIARVSLLAGRAAAELLQVVFGLGVLTAVGLAVGWAPHGSVGDTVAAYALLALWAFAGIWIGTYVGLIARDAETAQQFGFTAIFPLMFLSAIFVPIGHLATGLRQFAEWNPLTAVATAVRTLFHNPVPPLGSAWPVEHPILATVGWSLLLIAIFAPLAVRRYRRMAA